MRRMAGTRGEIQSRAELLEWKRVRACSGHFFPSFPRLSRQLSMTVPPSPPYPGAVLCLERDAWSTFTRREASNGVCPMMPHVIYLVSFDPDLNQSDAVSLDEVEVCGREFFDHQRPASQIIFQTQSVG